MQFSQIRKQKIDLADYNYLIDVESRLFLAKLDAFDITVLTEIINGSLKISIEQLADDLGLTEKVIYPILKKFTASKLFQILDDVLIVDKVKRKHYEAQIAKFQEDFEPGIEFLQSLLSQVPIHVLPTWYSLPKATDHIFNSIIEKYLLTPKIYEKYLSELVFDEPIIPEMIREVFQADQFLIKAKDLMEKFNLTHEEFEKKMLFLEFHFVCCLSYQQTNGRWEEVVTPFAEWREYLLFRQQSQPTTIEDSESIKRIHPNDFGFINDLASFLDQLKERSLAPELDLKLSQKEPPILAQNYTKNIIAKGLQLKLVELNGNQLQILPSAKDWLKLSLQDQALMIYRQPITKNQEWTFTDRDTREIERSLKKVMMCGWIYYDDFLKGFTADIGRAETVMLKNRGKRWKYVLPSYQEEELTLIKINLMGRLFESGMIAVGTHQNRLCFCVTPFGRVALE